jgi:hypothetical protein
MALVDTCCDGFFYKPSTSSSSASSSSSRSHSVKTQTLGKKFKVQLESLLGMLTTTKPHYIKCIKPNTMKVPNCFQGATCFSQLQALGIFEAVAIRKRGFPCRSTHAEFLRTYKPIFKHRLLSAPSGAVTGALTLKPQVDIIAAELNKASRSTVKSRGRGKGSSRVGEQEVAVEDQDSALHFFVGKTKVFSKFEAREAAKRLLDKYQLQCVIKIQAVCRGFSSRLAFCEFCYAALDANALLLRSVGDEVLETDPQRSLQEVDDVLLRLEMFPFQHYQRLAELRTRILARVKLLKEIEEMQHVRYSDINSKWMTTAQMAQKLKIQTPAAVRVQEMYETIMRGGDDTTSAPPPDSDDEEGPLAPELPDGEEGDEAKARARAAPVTVVDFPEREFDPQLSQLMCSLCRKGYESPPLKRSPRYLSCLHTFCSSCLTDRIHRSMSAGGLLCPHADCHVLSRCPEGVLSFKIAYVLVQQLPPICRNCESRNAVCHCEHCPHDSSLLCMACLKSHNKMKAYKTHTVRGLNSSETTTAVAVRDMSRCSHHPEKDLDTYCHTCQLLCCLSCAVFTHSGHQLQPLKEAAECERNRLLPCLSDLLNDVSSLQTKAAELTRTSPALEEQTKLMREISNHLFQGLHLSLANRRADFLSLLDLHYSQKRKALVEFTESLGAHITRQESSSKICSEMLEVGNDTEVLSVSSLLRSHLDDMILNSWQQDFSNLETTLSFSCGPEAELQNLIPSIGICRGSTICADPTKATLAVLQIGEFCEQWQVFLCLTLRNSKGQRILRGGHAVTLEVEEMIEEETTLPPSSLALQENQQTSPVASPTESGGVGVPRFGKAAFSLRSAQAVPVPTAVVQKQPPSSTATLPRASRRRTLRAAQKTKMFTTGIADNQDGTYHLLVTLRHPSPPRTTSMSSMDPHEEPSPLSGCPDVLRVYVKVFGVQVKGSPLIFHPHDAEEMRNYHPLTPSLGQTMSRREELGDVIPRSDTDPKTEFTSVSSFLKFISGGLIQS